MARQFTDPHKALHDLLDRYEGTPGRSALIAYVDHDGFRSVRDYDHFTQVMRHAENAGAIESREGKDNRRSQLVRVHLKSAEKLYAFLGRTPSVQDAGAQIGRARNRLKSAAIFDGPLGKIGTAWSRNKAWYGLKPGRQEDLINALLLAEAIVRERGEYPDYRTLSRRVTGDSKALERLESTVVRLLPEDMMPSGNLSPGDVLSFLGLKRFSQPLLLSGPIMLGGYDLVENRLPYLGIPPEKAHDLSLSANPDYVLIIENLTSFYRHVLEINRAGSGLVLYSGGFPSRAIQSAIAGFIERLDPRVPLLHWSDIDPGGLHIFRLLEKRLPRQVHPHLMTVELAERHGRGPGQPLKLKQGAASDSVISQLWDYLAGSSAKILEQEELDPELPFPSKSKTDLN